MYAFNGSESVARAHRLRKLMTGPPDHEKAMSGIQELIDERIAELNKRHEKEVDGGTGGPDAEP